MSRRRSSAGFTLVELLVSIAVLAISLGVVTGAIMSAFVPGTDRTAWSARVDEGRREAIQTGTAVVVWPDSAHAVSPVLFLPDGRTVGGDETQVRP